MTSFPISEFTNRITIYLPTALSPNGKKLAYISNITGAPQVWLGEINSKVDKLLFPTPITSEKEKSPNVFNNSLCFINDDLLAILKDKHGDEKTFIEIHHLKTGEVEVVPAGEGRDAINFTTKDKIFFTSNREDGVSTGLYIYHLKTKKVEHIYTEKNASLYWYNIELKKDQYLFGKALSNTTSILKSINIKSKKVETIFDDQNSSVHPICKLSNDKLLVTSSFQRQFVSLATLNLKTKSITFVEKDKWDVNDFVTSKNNKNLFLTRNVAGKHVLEGYSLPSLKKLNIKFKSDGVITDINYSNKDKSLIIGMMSPTEPKNYYRYDIKSKKYQRLTNTWTSRIPEKNLVKPQSVYFESQGAKIQSWLFLPKTKAKKFPVIIWPHGGPQAQERAQFRPMLQFLISKGYAIWAPNHHGSTGFGIDFANSINRNWGTKDLPDMINGINWLKKSGKIDEKNIFIMGGSYGGYMTLRSITKIPNTFRAAIDIFGPSNLLTFVDSVPLDWRPFMDAMTGNSKEDYEMLKEQSPIFSLDKIDCPLLVIQGAKDPRVIKKESDQIVEELKLMNKQVEYVVYEDEGHGFLKTENELHSFVAVSHFLDKYLKK